VLNAFRHHRGGHHHPLVASNQIELCSTPFGITEVGIRPAVGTGSGLFRAQRLSASQRWACVSRSPGNRGDSRAQRLSASQRWAYLGAQPVPRDVTVLNAFRHHRGGHTHNRSSHESDLYVLNAFRHHRGGHKLAWLITPASCGAQRLSASQRWASGRPQPQGQALSVLNAFRHHRGGHIRKPHDPDS